MRALLASIALACALFAAVLATFMSARIFVASFLLGLLSLFLQKNAILRVGERRALIQFMVYFEVLFAVLPNAFTALVISGFGPGGLGMMVLLSLYYVFPASIFGKELFLTEMVIAPHGVGGILLSAAFFAVVGSLIVFGLHLVARKVAARARRAGGQVSS